MELITGVLLTTEKCFNNIEASLGRCGVPRQQWQTLAAARSLVEYAKAVFPVASIGRMDLLDGDSPAAHEFATAEDRFGGQQRVVAEAQAATAAWRQKLPAAEAPVALEQAKSFERSLFAWLQPAWWRLRRILNQSYDFRKHVVRPRWSQVISALQREYDQLTELDRQRKAIADRFGLDGDVDGMIGLVQQLRRPKAAMAADLSRIHAALVKIPQGPADRHQDGRGRRAASFTCHGTRSNPARLHEYSLGPIAAESKQMPESLNDLPAFLACLAEIAALPPPVGAALRTLPLTVEQIEAATADRSLVDAYRQERPACQFHGHHPRPARRPLGTALWPVACRQCR